MPTPPDPRSLPAKNEGMPKPEDWDSWVDAEGPELGPPELAHDGKPVAQSPVTQAPVTPTPLVTSGFSEATPGPQEAPPLVLVETAFLASTSALLWLINFYFPLGPVFRICFPIPIALVYLRWNQRAAWMAAIVASLLLSVLMGPVRSLFFLIPSGLLGVMLGACWRRGAGWGVSIVLGSLINSLGFFVRVGVTSILLGEDLWVYVMTQVTRLLEWVAVRFNLLFQPDLMMVQGLAVGLVMLQSLIYLLTVHLVAWFVLERLSIRMPAPPRWVQVMLEMES